MVDACLFMGETVGVGGIGVEVGDGTGVAVGSGVGVGLGGMGVGVGVGVGIGCNVGIIASVAATNGVGGSVGKEDSVGKAGISTGRSGVSAGDSVGNTNVGSDCAVAFETGKGVMANVDTGCGGGVTVAVTVVSLCVVSAVRVGVGLGSKPMLTSVSTGWI